jgi:hypothetical protein
MRISTFNNNQDNTPKPLELTFSELCDRLENPIITPCDPCVGKDCPHKNGKAFTPAIYRPGTTRGKKNVEAVTAIVLDFDVLSKEGIAKVLQKIYELDYEGMYHTTHSHRSNSICIRVVFNVSENIPAEKWPQVWEYFASQFGHDLIDTSAKDSSRLFYFASKGVSTPFKSLRFEGRLVDWRELPIGSNAAPIAKKDTQQAVTGTVADNAQAPVDMIAARKRLYYARNPETRMLMRRILDGAPMADEGARDNTLHRACSAAARILWDHPSESILEILRPSLELMPGTPPPAGWIAEARKKIVRAIEERERDRGEAQRLTGEIADAMRLAQAKAADPEAFAEAIQEGTPLADIIKPYSAEELDRWAKEAGCSSVNEFMRQLIIQKNDVFFIHNGDKGYHKSLPERTLRSSLSRDLARYPIEVQVENKQGKMVPRETRSILDDHTTVARELTSTLIAQKSHYDPRTQTFYEAVCPMRFTVGEYHPDIAELIHLWDPTDELLDWFAVVPRLERLAAILYVHGDASCGKTLIGTGAARLWTTGAPTPMEVLAESGNNGFNDALSVCPFVFADEKMPPVKNMMAHLRSQSGSTSRQLNRKFMPSATLVGAIRIYIAGNNDALLDSDDKLTEADIDAVKTRIRYVKIPKEASRFMVDYAKKYKGRIQEEWLNSDAIAKHVLWISQNHKFQEQRFIGAGGDQTFHDSLATSTGSVALVVEFIARYLSQTTLQDTPLLVCGEGELFVSTDLMSGIAWGEVFPGKHAPTALVISSALKSIMKERVIKQHPTKGSITYFRVRPRVITDFMGLRAVGEKDRAVKYIDQPNELVKKWLTN